MVKQFSPHPLSTPAPATMPRQRQSSLNFNRFLRRLNRSAAFFIRNEKTYLFKNEKPLFLLAPGKSAYHLKIFNGPSTTPDDVATLAPPRAGEMLCVLYRANKILAWSRAAVKTSFSTSGGIDVDVRCGNVHLSEIRFLVEEQFEGMQAVFLAAVSRKLHLMGFGSVYIACRDKYRYGIRSIVKAGFVLEAITSRYHLLGGEIVRTVRLVQFQNRQVPDSQRPKRLPAAASSKYSNTGITSAVESHHK